MPSELSIAVLRDMAYHIRLAQSFSEGLDRTFFGQDLRAVYAVTRCLEIISEASRRLPAAMKARHPSIAWRDMAACRERLSS